MDNKKPNIWYLLLAVFIFLWIGALTFSKLEGWNILDAFYFVTMTATTVGYGDLIPTHATSKVITIFYSLLIIPFILYAFNTVAKYEVERVNRQVRGIQKKQSEQELEIEASERKIREQKKLIKEQQAAIEKQNKEIKKQEKINREQGDELKKYHRNLKKAEKDIKEHDEELEIVEDFVEDQMSEELSKKKK